VQCIFTATYIGGIHAKTSLKLTQNTIKNRSLIFCCILTVCSFCAHAQWRQLYDEMSVYVVAHQDDWQLFMGTNVYNDIAAYDEKNAGQNGRKVVIIYTTAGNLHDDDDSKSCMCKDPYHQLQEHIPYWQVREAGTKNSINLAACRMSGWGPHLPYPENEAVVINGHPITKYVFKNTVSYYLRLKAGMYGAWRTNPSAPVGTVDSSTVYADRNDLVNTLYYIYQAEKDSSLVTSKISFNFPDIDENINPNDHSDHLIAGRIGCEAAKLLSANMNQCFPESLFVDYNTQNMPENLGSPDVQNESALTAVYCMALLDHNAWPEWSDLYRTWDSRNYFRTITTCDNPVQANIMAQDSLVSLSAKAYPSPANQNVFVRFSLPVRSLIQVKVIDSRGTSVYAGTADLATDNTVSINTGSFANGTYLIMLSQNGSKLANIFFEVQH
jgi:Secretion system C-terminal sorting domain